MSKKNRIQSEAGSMALSNLVGAALGTLVIGGLITFWLTSDDTSRESRDRTDKQASAHTAMNRAGRDVAEARHFVAKDEDAFVVEKVTTKPDGTTTRVHTRYAVADGTDNRGRDTKVMVRQVQHNAPERYSRESFDPSSEQVLGMDVDPEATKFVYRTPSGSLAERPADVGRVDITYVASAAKGKVELQSSATLDGVESVAGQGNGDLSALPDEITIVAGQQGLVDVLANDHFAGAASVAIVPGHSFPGSLTVLGGGVDGVSVNAPSVSSPAVFTVEYTLNDQSGSTVTSTIDIAVRVPVTAPDIEFNSACSPTSPNTYVLPNITGATYFVNGTQTGPGVHSAAAGSSVRVDLHASTTPAPGYVVRDGDRYVSRLDAIATFEFAQTDCAVQAWVGNAQPDSFEVNAGTNVVEWTGGSLEYRLVAGPGIDHTNSSTAWTTVPQATGVAGGTIELPVALDTRYQYRVAGGVNTTTSVDQFPTAPTVQVEPRTLAGGGRANRVSVTEVSPVVVDTDVVRLQSHLDEDGDIALRSLGVEEGAGTSTPAWTRDLPSTAGTESVYVGVAQTRCRTAKGGPIRDCYSFGGGQSTEAMVATQGLYAAEVDEVVRAYQPPAETPIGVVAGHESADQCVTSTGERLVDAEAAGADNGLYHCASRTADISWVKTNSDHGMPADSQFCSYPGNPGECGVEARRGNAVFTKATEGDSEAGSLPTVASDWGTRDTYEVRSCNVEGCSTKNLSKSLVSFPAPFTVTEVEHPINRRTVSQQRWVYIPGSNGFPTNWTGVRGPSESDSGSTGWQKTNVTSDAQVRLNWSNSRGAGNVTYEWRHENAATGAVERDWGLSGSNGTDTYTAWRDVAALREYRFKVKAVTDTNATGRALRRSATVGGPNANANETAARFVSAPPAVAYYQDSPFCRKSNNNGWKHGFWYKTQVVGADGGDITGRYPLSVRYMWWTKVMRNDATNEVGEEASKSWNLSSANNPSSWAAPGNWTRNTGPYYGFSTVSADRSWRKHITSGVIPYAGGANEGNAWGGVGHVRTQVFWKRGDVGNPHFGAPNSGFDDFAPGMNGGAADGNMTRSRVTGVTENQVKNCYAADFTNASNGYDASQFSFDDGHAWHTAAAGYRLNRQYPINAGSVAKTATPNQNSRSFKGWNEVD